MHPSQTTRYRNGVRVDVHKAPTGFVYAFVYLGSLVKSFRYRGVRWNRIAPRAVKEFFRRAGA